jgi:tRNA(Ile)-lysidine synthase
VYPRRGPLVRPLLDVARADLRTFLRDRGESWVDDESNADVSNPRNRMRHVVLPELDRALGGASRPNLARAAALAAEDAAWLDDLAATHAAQLVTDCANGVYLDTAGLVALPPPLARRVLLRALRRIAAGREVGLSHVEDAMAVAAGLRGGADVPGGRVEPNGGNLVLIQQKPLPK